MGKNFPETCWADLRDH